MLSSTPSLMAGSQSSIYAAPHFQAHMNALAAQPELLQVPIQDDVLFSGKKTTVKKGTAKKPKKPARQAAQSTRDAEIHRLRHGRDLPGEGAQPKQN
ncbi:MAG: hypothetical protein VKJ04_12070 [Vampirovibrionales bacterium]|nr:hypothetical protein [Vampirovibrionales bacterium]